MCELDIEKLRAFFIKLFTLNVNISLSDDTQLNSYICLKLNKLFYYFIILRILAKGLKNVNFHPGVTFNRKIARCQNILRNDIYTI